MSGYGEQIAATMGERESMEQRTVVPESYYPVTITLADKITPSKKKGTPMMQLSVMITAGPFEGVVLSQYDSQVPLSGKTMDFLAHLTKQVTGKRVDYGVYDEYGFVPSDVNDKRKVREEFAEFFEGLDEEQRCDFMAKYVRAGTWDGRDVIAKIGVEDDTFERVNNETGEKEQIATSRNRITSLFALDHPKFGKAQVERTFLPQQERAWELMNS